jgi:nucleoid-associated protein YgaU
LSALSAACGGGGGSQPTAAPAGATPPAAASPVRPPLASPIAAASPSVAGSPSPQPGEQSYTVEPGDSMLSISEQFYGDVTQWRRIYDANREVIGDNPDALKPGMVLRIPPPPSPTPGG